MQSRFYPLLLSVWPGGVGSQNVFVEVWAQWKQWTPTKPMHLKREQCRREWNWGIFLSTRHEIGYAFAKFMFFLLGTLKVILGGTLFQVSCFSCNFFFLRTWQPLPSQMSWSFCHAGKCPSDLNIGHEMEGCLRCMRVWLGAYLTGIGCIPIASCFFSSALQLFSVSSE